MNRPSLLTAAVLAITAAPMGAVAHVSEDLHVHAKDPSLLLGLGLVTALSALAVYLKRRRV